MTDVVVHPTHVIFDFDGLLVDTEIIYTRANTFMLNKFGKEFTMELKRGQMGMKNAEAVVWLINAVGIADKITPEEYEKEYNAFLEAEFLKATPLPGARKLVEHLVKSGVEVAICTGSCSKSFEVKARNHKEWLDLIPIQVMSGDDPNVKRGKPHPDGFLYTMSKFANPPASPKHVLVFEDAPNGYESAIAAGMQCVLVPDLNVFQPTDDHIAKCRHVLSSLELFDPVSCEFPAF